jgi:hypothetical protein
LAHAKGLSERQILSKAARGKAPVLIAEENGSLIPTVQCTAQEGAKKADRRKCRKLAWKEARVSLVRRLEAISPVYAVTLGSPEEAGHQLKRLAELSGLKPKSRVHGLDDGAPWIAEQMEVQFGAQGSYLIDFYHFIDSGEVESAHRSLIQKRLKLPGAWWRIDNAQAMLNLRTMRANRQWNSYWRSLQS